MSETPPTPPVRRRDAAATRQAILDSARAAFARAGYDGAGLREIAAGAGVTAILVNRYFGNKEGLFAEAVAASMATTTVVLPRILKAGATGADIAAALLSVTDAHDVPLEGFQIMLRSASSEVAARIAREQIELFHQKAIAGSLKGARRDQRAALLLSLIAGLQIMRQMIALSPLAEADPKRLAEVLGGVIQHLIDAPAK
ncbi:TetR/AcrR family transcriptional regulator [Mitsuaria sp. GD03876]|uniref:TetR/AcrR family transcriptional regulator n=1 Tax=Mitsuaria sp. GD03876 TaxID=2975399 RepID=UPI00244BCE25|nr:TetR/AcrR family transcriptional regulator [Mitsuaria sp. GD03876]MDH0864452.1 TetR family transcriptional regulator [Mitsuaria sp. GD03876]